MQKGQQDGRGRPPTTEPTRKAEDSPEAARLRSRISIELRDLRAAQAASRERALAAHKSGNVVRAIRQERREISFTPAILRREDALRFLDEKAKELQGETGK